jgi:hypothetical protein
MRIGKLKILEINRQQTVLPRKLRLVTRRRVYAALKKPLVVLRNLKFLLGDEVSNERHIFVVGPPRSGTTLVKNVLRAHTEICGVDDETYFFSRKNYVDFRHPSVSDARMKRLIAQARSAVDLFDRFADTRKKQANATIFLEKTPEHALWLDYILRHFPESEVIFVVRDPRDAFRSAKDNPSYWQGLPSADPLGGYMETWRRSVVAYCDHRDTECVHLVRYEEFCQRPDQELGRIMARLEMCTQDQQLQPASYAKTRVSRKQGHGRLSEPISTKTIGKWREVLGDSEVERIENYAKDKISALGYRLEDRNEHSSR